jgi:hypothetical protein
MRTIQPIVMLAVEVHIVDPTAIRCVLELCPILTMNTMGSG